MKTVHHRLGTAKSLHLDQAFVLSPVGVRPPLFPSSVKSPMVYPDHSFDREPTAQELRRTAIRATMGAGGVVAGSWILAEG